MQGRELELGAGGNVRAFLLQFKGCHPSHETEYLTGTFCDFTSGAAALRQHSFSCPLCLAVPWSGDIVGGTSLSWSLTSWSYTRFGEMDGWMAYKGPTRERGKIALKETKRGGKIRAGLLWIQRQWKVFWRRGCLN